MKYLMKRSKLMASGGQILCAKEYIPPVTWFWDDDTALYGIGNNIVKAYNCWCPHNFQFDPVRHKFIFVQCHQNAHTGGTATKANATMHVIHPDDILKREDIAIPEMIGVANFVILDDGTYVLYPKTTEAIRYVSEDGGATWMSEALNGSLQHAFGIYYCNGEYYAGCDYEWGEYHHSVDGLNWETVALDWTDENGCHTKEHAFCYWEGHVYAFGRRDFWVNDDAGQGLVEDYNGCAVVFRLDGDQWTVIDDSSLLAFQSNCSPFVFEGGIAIAHMHRVDDPVLYYTVYDGTSFTTLQTFSGLTKTGGQAACTTPSLAFGNGYACIAFSCMPVIAPLADSPYQRAFNTIVVGTYRNLSFETYFDYNLIQVSKLPVLFYNDPSSITFYPAGASENITYRWSPTNLDAIVNNNDYEVYFHITEHPKLIYQPILNDTCYIVYDGKFVNTSVLNGNVTNNISHNFIFDYDGRHYAVSGRTNAYGTGTGGYAATPRNYVLECTLPESSTQPSGDISNVPNGTIVHVLSASGGVMAGSTTAAVISVTE